MSSIQYIARRARAGKPIRTGWQWDVIKRLLRREAWEYEDGNMVQRLFVGTTFAIMPSGKYWTWWASGNVDADEAEADTLFWDTLEEQASKHGLFLSCGEGDPCDIFVGRCRDLNRAERKQHQRGEFMPVNEFGFVEQVR